MSALSLKRVVYILVVTASVGISGLAGAFAASAYHLPVEWGVFVGQIDPGSPAEDAGLRRGDIIFKIGSITLDNDHPYINALYSNAPGEVIPLGVQRGNQSLEIQVTLGERGND